MCGSNPIAPKILDMGYRIPVLRTEGSSYYGINDETRSVLRVAVRLNGAMSEAQHGNFSINASVDITVFTPRQCRRPDLFNPRPQDPQSSVIDEDVVYDTMLEEPNVYAIGDALISAKPAIAQIKRTSLYTSNGEPMYLVNAIPLFKVLKDRASPAGAHTSSEEPAATTQRT